MDKVYIVMRNSDQTEGRGPVYPVTDLGFFMSYEDAESASNQNGYIKDEIICLHKSNSEILNRKRELQQTIRDCQKELRELNLK